MSHKFHLALRLARLPHIPLFSRVKYTLKKTSHKQLPDIYKLAEHVLPSSTPGCTQRQKHILDLNNFHLLNFHARMLHTKETKVYQLLKVNSISHVLNFPTQVHAQNHFKTQSFTDYCSYIRTHVLYLQWPLTHTVGQGNFFVLKFLLVLFFPPGKAEKTYLVLYAHAREVSRLCSVGTYN